MNQPIPTVHPVPKELDEPPALPLEPHTAPIRGEILLVNPFYPKDPHGSFGKHVLTPSLALTSIAAATPTGWRVRYWDENLLQGPPPVEPFPEVVGITVHLTFARARLRARALVPRRGAEVVLGGLHVRACPDEAAPHADALAIGEGSAVWPRSFATTEQGALEPRYDRGSFGAPTARSPRRAEISSHGAGLPHHREPDRHPRLPQPLRLLLPRDRRACACPTRCASRPGRAADRVESGQPYGVFVDNNLGSNRSYLRPLCRALRPLENIWSAAVTIDVTDDPDRWCGRWRSPAAPASSSASRSLTPTNLADAGKKTPRPSDYAERVELLHQQRHPGQRQLRARLRPRRPPTSSSAPAEWIEEDRLECATFHILTPYPGTPLFARLEAEGRILHRDWDLYDTAHAVFRPGT